MLEPRQRRATNDCAKPPAEADKDERIAMMVFQPAPNVRAKREPTVGRQAREAEDNL